MHSIIFPSISVCISPHFSAMQAKTKKLIVSLVFFKKSFRIVVSLFLPILLLSQDLEKFEMVKEPLSQESTHILLTTFNGVLSNRIREIKFFREGFCYTMGDSLSFFPVKFQSEMLYPGNAAWFEFCSIFPIEIIWNLKREVSIESIIKWNIFFCTTNSVLNIISWIKCLIMNLSLFYMFENLTIYFGIQKYIIF